ncbi:hypothetical protein HOP50_11g64690 [Chloropicon primus]|uniref:Uncharacterized protein n=1 Tax=Chloropicon primus TaxID=1764295 RepID=A0A5B8MUC5_9CHLO|nr:hypothetical protein A3770_11p64490 [Chloropicon primus]UPR03142.1 hypothetical protein HOP50_11g64690 [Chloropicon primus]|mmetsp:Transcript_13442/g.37768  ORF Transcript_13442/g.37768 Transcript_13442/m.37768 type:complete len:252 (+) Transcript_13442:525-1280(+)|eukprot:QDZ23931.1 hypothetical protein A3770_11p64490 [Chloropicon primus]
MSRGSAVEEFGAAAAWAIAQGYALSVPFVLGVHELWAAVALVVAVVGFQFLLYDAGAPNAAVQLAAFLSQGLGKEEEEAQGTGTRSRKKKLEEKKEAERIRLGTAVRTISSTMAGSVVGSVFARDTLAWLGFSAEGMKPPVTHFPDLGDNFVLGVEVATSLAICALSVIVFPKRPVVGLAGLFLVPVPAALVGVPGIDPAWSLGRAFAAKDFQNNSLYLVGPFAGALAFGLACHLGSKAKSAAGAKKRKTN